MEKLVKIKKKTTGTVVSFVIQWKMQSVYWEENFHECLILTVLLSCIVS